MAASRGGRYFLLWIRNSQIAGWRILLFPLFWTRVETSSRWHDPYIQARCNLSNLTWLMTANAIEPVATVLRDRCRIIRFPEPGPEHLRFLAARIMQRLYGEFGYDPRWITPLEGFELEALAGVWQGGSIRKLERLVEGLIDAREHQRRRH